MMPARLPLLLVAILALAPTRAQAQDQPPPNIVLIFCDDLGYADIGCFGAAQHRTPNIDRLAEQGLRLTSFYSTSGVCTPSRSSLMTGCYPRRVNMHVSAGGDWVLFPVARKGLAPAEVTMAEVLARRGYTTGCIGKWHLGDQPPFLPTRQGFDSYFGIPYSNDMGAKQRKRNPPLPLLRGEEVIEAPVDQTTLTRRYTDEAVRFLHDNREGPFFLYLPHTFPHLPLYASPDFAGKSANGPYGDAVEEIDASTGRILDTLRELGLEQTTLVIFTSDNGASSRAGGSNAPLRGHKGSTWEGGMRVSCVARWPGVVPAGAESGELMSTLDLLPTLAALAGADLSGDPRRDGLDASGVLRGGPSPRTSFLYYFKDQLQAVRGGPWKLHLERPEKDGQRQAELYNLVEDIGETTNVIGEHAAIVAQLEALAAEARADLGDRQRLGAGQRPAAILEDPAQLRLPAK